MAVPLLVAACRVVMDTFFHPDDHFPTLAALKTHLPSSAMLMSLIFIKFKQENFLKIFPVLKLKKQNKAHVCITFYVFLGMEI